VLARKLVIFGVSLRKGQEQGLRSRKIGSLLFVNDQFCGKRNAVIGVFLETLINFWGGITI
jgi:hypothetical protein